MILNTISTENGGLVKIYQKFIPISRNKKLSVFSCRTESAAALAKTFLRGPGGGLLGDVSKFLSTCTLMNSVGGQHVVSILPACCLHVANKLPACCQHVASMLSACCQQIISMLPVSSKHIVPGCCQHVASMLPVCCQHVVSMLPVCC